MRRLVFAFGLFVLVSVLAFGAPPRPAPADIWDRRVPVEDWVHDVCVASRAAERGLDTAGTPSIQPSGTDAAAIRDSITEMLGDFRSYAEGFSDAVGDAGVPAVRGGKKLEDGMVEALDHTAAVAQNAQQRIAALPVSDASAFASAAGQVLDDVEEEMEPVISALSPALDRRYPKIDRAKARDPKCDGVE
jgi:hypothetical protein